MSTTKIVIAVLVVVLVLFAGVIFTGPWDHSSADANSFSAKDYPSLASLNSLLTPLAPKVSAQSLKPPTQIFDLQSTPEYKLAVSADPAKKFRQLAFTATPSKACASVIYTPSETGGLNQVETSDKAGSSDHPEKFAFILSSAAGQLEVKRAAQYKGSTLCVLTLQVAP